MGGNRWVWGCVRIVPDLSYNLSHVEDWGCNWHQCQISFGVTNPDFYYILEHIKKWFLSKMLLVNYVPYFSIWNVHLILPVFRLPEPDFRFAISGSGNANWIDFFLRNITYNWYYSKNVFLLSINGVPQKYRKNFYILVFGTFQASASAASHICPRPEWVLGYIRGS